MEVTGPLPEGVSIVQFNRKGRKGRKDKRVRILIFNYFVTFAKFLSGLCGLVLLPLRHPPCNRKASERHSPFAFRPWFHIGLGRQFHLAHGRVVDK